MKSKWKSSGLLRFLMGVLHTASALVIILFLSGIGMTGESLSGVLRQQRMEESDGFLQYLYYDYADLAEYLQERAKRSDVSWNEEEKVIYIYNQDRTEEKWIARNEAVELGRSGVFAYVAGEEYRIGGGAIEYKLKFNGYEESWYAQNLENGHASSTNVGLENLFYGTVAAWCEDIYMEEVTYANQSKEYQNPDTQISNFRYYVEEKDTGKAVISCGMGRAEDQENLLGAKEAEVSNYRVVYGVDKNLTANDEYAAYAREYQRLEKYQNILGTLLLAGGLGWLFSLSMILVCTGHKKHHDTVVLTRMDHMRLEGYTALLTVGLFLLWTVVMVPVSILTGGIGGNGVSSVAAGTSVIGTIYLGGFLLMLTCIRRFKAHTTLTDNFLLLSAIRSVFRWVKEGFAALYKDRSVAGRVILGFVTYLLTNLLLVFLWDGGLYNGAFRFMVFCLLLALNIGALAFLLRYVGQRKKIFEGAEKQAKGDWDQRIDTSGMWEEEKKLAENINQIGERLQKAVDSATRNERMKTELIVNVSHDIKTPLTSIINYVDLIRREDCENEKIRNYIRILDQKSQRLKQLTEDLVEAAKANTGNIELDMAPLDMVQLLRQAVGELEDKFEARRLQVIPSMPEDGTVILADGRRLWRVFENLLNNACKYAMPGTRVYMDVWKKDGKAVAALKNISENPLNIPADELTERFTRGDASRSTEGSGLGLSIAKSLTELMGGSLELYLDGDLFRVTVQFPEIQKKEPEKELKPAGEPPEEDSWGEE